MKTRTWTVLHLFSGIGGCTLGFKRAGLVSVGSIDFDAKACEQLRKMTGTPAFHRDLATLQPAELREIVPASPDVLVMSPPCKSFSGCMPAARAAEDHYVDMSQLAVRGMFLGLETWPKPPGVILIENVPRIETRGAALLEQLVKLGHRYGFAVDMSTHDCGEIGGLAQHRQRFLAMFRHMERVPAFIRKPPTKRVRNVGEVLLPLPSPVADHGDPMHRLPLLSPLNWLRLALIPPGKDWRALPASVRIGGENPSRHAGKLGVEDTDAPAHTVVGRGNRPGSGWSSFADPRVGFAGPNTQSGIFGVEDPEQPAHVVTGNARVTGSRGAVADPRVAWDRAVHGGRPDSFGVGSMDEPSLVVRGRQEVQTSRASIADPRIGEDGDREPRSGSYGVTDVGDPAATVRGRHDVWSAPASLADPRLGERPGRQNGGFGVEDMNAPSHAVLGEGTVRNTRASVADPRLGCDQRAGSYGVQETDQPAQTVLGSQSHDNSRSSLADPRLGHTPRRGTMGVMDLEAPAPTIRANHDVRQAPAAVVDARGWPIPTHELVFEAGEWVLYGPELDLTSKRACYLVIRSWSGDPQRKGKGHWARALTDRELFTLQAGPVDHVVEGPRSSSKTQAGVREWIGNMIPVDAAEAIGIETILALESSSVAGILRGPDVWVERADAVMALEGAA